MVLMALAVISMVFFQAWSYMGPKLEQWFGSSGPRTVVGTIDGRTVRFGELLEFHTKLRQAAMADLQWRVDLSRQATDSEMRQRLVNLYLQIMAMRFPWVTEVLQERMDAAKTIVWVALYDEARRAGIEATRAEAENYLKSVKDAGLSAEAIQRTISQAGGGDRTKFVEALRTEMTLRMYVQWLGETLSGAVDPEVRRLFAQVDERIKVRLAVLRAADFVSQVGEIPDPVIQEQFNKYKSYPPGKGPEGFGYRIPDRVAVEYLVADPKAFEEQAKPKVTDEMIRQYYEAAKDTQYLVKDEKPAEAKKDEARKDEAKKEEAKPPEKEYRPLEEVREEIRKKLVEQESAALARERMEADVAEIRAAKRGADLAIWADGKQVRRVALLGLHTPEQLAELAGIGKAVRGSETFPADAMAMMELVGQAHAKLSVMEISEPFVGPSDECYAFRVTNIEKSREPTSLAEVRDRVVTDVRETKAFEITREKARKLLETAAEKGLVAAADAAKVPVTATEWFSREQPIPSVPPEIGASRVVVGECFRMTDEGRQRTLVTLAENRTAVVAEWADRRPPREAGYAAQRMSLVNRVGGQVGRAALAQAVSPKSIQERMAVVVTLPEAQPRQHDKTGETDENADPYADLAP